ncbi:hypothetical protein NQ317_002819 [Molorchus minor]|uniref:BSD domain-containing protein n=1 Tax=Molorchus minor TaxID=1323400 RepID=A0ABQ9JNH4_9CUCU|nr:hypothetical protein NQ317_002819 [Molorchus minor]
MKRTFSSFLGQMNSALNPSPDDSDTEILIVENSETVRLTKLQKVIYELQKDPTTFLCDPEPELGKQFQCWLEIIDDQLSDDRIAKHVNSSEILKNQYAKLVPDIVEHQLFWKRYLFKKALLEDDIARQEAIDRREQKEKLITEDSVKWDQEDFSNEIELTEEEQIKLLEQYEEERKRQKLSPMHKPSVGETNALLRQGKAIKEPSLNNNMDIDCDKSEVGMNKIGSAVSLADTPSSGSSTDGDWEKICDVEK